MPGGTGGEKHRGYAANPEKHGVPGLCAVLEAKNTVKNELMLNRTAMHGEREKKHKNVKVPKTISVQCTAIARTAWKR